jgi:hypothetical protein
MINDLPLFYKKGPELDKIQVWNGTSLYVNIHIGTQRKK